MESIKVKELKFKQVPLKDASNFTCNYCACAGFTHRWWRAVVKFMAGAQFKILLCSDYCKKGFMENPKSQKWMDDSMERIAEVHSAKPLNPQKI
jgi:hypothetical protein